MPSTTLSVQHLQRHRLPSIITSCSDNNTNYDEFHTINITDDDDANNAILSIPPSDNTLYIISEHDYVRSLIPNPALRDVCAKSSTTHLPYTIGSPRRKPRRLMAAITTYVPDVGAPGSPPDLTNSKSSKSSSFHSETLSDLMGPSDLSHFEDINLDDVKGPAAFPMQNSTSTRVVYDARSASLSNVASSRTLTASSKNRYPSLKGQVNGALKLQAPAKPGRRGFSSPSAPSLSSANMSLAAPPRSSRSPSPSGAHTFAAAPRTLSRKSSRGLEVMPSPGLNARRQSWQDSKRKTLKEREAECDDEEDEELPEDAVIWNVPISPRPVQERSPAPSTCGSPPRGSPSLSVISNGGSSARTSPGPSTTRFPQRMPSPRSASRENFPPGLTRQRTNNWEDTYTSLDPDAKKMTEALEEFQVESERKQEVQRQQPGLTRSTSVSQLEPKSKKSSLPPVRKSDPLIDPFQPSVEKQKYLSRTRPSWLPPKNPKEEKKHLKEYQRMLARIEEAERLEAQRAQSEALAREKASRIKAEYWTTLLPKWDTEMADPALRATHRKMWWNGIPPRLRGAVWQRAVGNDLEVTETTYTIALQKAQQALQQQQSPLSTRYPQILACTRTVFPELCMFAPPATTGAEPQALHTDLVNICLAYATYRPDIPPASAPIHHIAALLLLSLSPAQSFVTLSNLLNRPLPLSFLINDENATHAAYATTLNALGRKHAGLAKRLETLRVEPRDYLQDMFGSLFCARLGVEAAARVMDVYVVEGDKIPPRVAVAVLGELEGRCGEGGREDVLRVLRGAEVGGREVDGFMGRVFEAGKS
ncbi:hypothetical protein P153DRAFT_330984 [Dothidotthia symphoricarpi CBS 119687]|uniref:Rab-GAP TBC domain-containing protein n=1 Tax=Dothidotthia symphoricarpi CBS 119687 TaxID=1392245 RepID=A0A6A6AQ63_9PLEO|nr:uncharacterized protein P153DRAFT_330984 [Dothidotthia symphoricarpi CBS 119687]KAF2134142.1 hypothetical protein P153DRAFT_330984 [Dothidotthia symphoricarpi CBS 119687]